VREIAEVLPLARFKPMPGRRPGSPAVRHRGALVPVIDLSQIACGRGAARPARAWCW
jgi:chemotaxis-related protein WspB